MDTFHTDMGCVLVVLHSSGVWLLQGPSAGPLPPRHRCPHSPTQRWSLPSGTGRGDLEGEHECAVRPRHRPLRTRFYGVSEARPARRRGTRRYERGRRGQRHGVDAVCDSEGCEGQENFAVAAPAKARMLFKLRTSREISCWASSPRAEVLDPSASRQAMQ